MAVPQLLIAHGSAHEQLRSEAELRTRLLQVEAELDQMTSALLETQDQLLAMYELTRAMRSHRGIADMLQHLAVEAARLVKTQGAVVYLAPTMVQHPAGLVDEHFLFSIFTRVYTSGQELVLGGPAAHLPEGLANICMLPIRVRGAVGAALGLINCTRGFSAPDLKLARAIAEQAGVQIEHTLLHQEMLAQARIQAEMEIAHKVQSQLLPQTRPRIATLDIFAESRAAMQVGGDFYDFVCEPGRSPMFLLGDVSGKGISAALIMGMVRSVARGAARFMPHATPATVLSRANNDLYDDLTMLEAFVTTFVAQYDAAAAAMHYANAGHAPVIYRPLCGPARLIEGDGVPVGVLPIDMCENRTLAFGPGTLLIVATDGFNEARSPSGEQFGYDRLLALADEFADQPAQVIAYAIFDAVESFAAGRPQEDDQTLIVLKGTMP